MKVCHIFGKRSWTFLEIEGDLFRAPKEYALAHCVGEDLRMGAGIAYVFRTKFGCLAKLEAQNAKTGDIAVLCAENRLIYYLVTKKYSNQIPKYADLLRSLIKMRKHMINHNIKKLAIPRIGCGLDRLKWDAVRDLLERVFAADNVEILVYTYTKHA